MSTIIHAVHVHWSESPFFPEMEKEYSLKEFEHLASLAATRVGDAGGYDKTKVTLWLDEGHIDGVLIRIDLNAQETGVRSYYRNVRAHLEQELSKPNLAPRMKPLYEEKLAYINSIDWEASMELEPEAV